MKRKNGLPYPYDTIDLSKQQVFVNLGGKFYPVNNASIVLNDSEPSGPKLSRNSTSSPESDAEILRALL